MGVSQIHMGCMRLLHQLYLWKIVDTFRLKQKIVEMELSRKLRIPPYCFSFVNIAFVVLCLNKVNHNFIVYFLNFFQMFGGVLQTSGSARHRIFVEKCKNFEVTFFFSFFFLNAISFLDASDPDFP